MRRSLIYVLVFVLLVAGGLLTLAWAHAWPRLAVMRPWWLLAALCVPVLLVRSWKPLAGLGDLRRVLVLGLRSILVLLLILAIADLQSVREEEGVTTLVLIDRSFSIPAEIRDPNSLRDERWERLLAALRQSTQETVPHRIGAISFARGPRLEYPPGPVTPLGLNLRLIGAGLDRSFTDIGAAVRLGLASFQEGGARRLVLISDGNENRGNALAAAQVAKLNGIPIDVVPLRYEFDNEILVDRIDAPSDTPPDQDVPIRVVIRNYTSDQVRGTLFLSRLVGAQTERVSQSVTLEPGLNVLQTKWPARGAVLGGVVIYRAVFMPDNLPGDRADNNEAWVPVIISGGQKQVLVVVQTPDSPRHRPLLEALASRPAGPRPRIQVTVWTPDQLPSENDARRHELAQFDTVIFVNIPADMVSRDQQEALRKVIRDQGAGMVMVGGPDGFGAGRWQGEPLEEALPVDTAIRAMKTQVKGGLVLIMHASEMAEGNYWQKEIARLAVSKLAPQDEVGVLYYAFGASATGHVWHVPLQPVGPNRSRIIRDIGTMEPGDMPEFDPSFMMAEKALSEPQRGLGVRHIILVSDGDHGMLQNFDLLDQFRRSRITLTTVGVTTHGPAAHERLAEISSEVGGRHYPVDDPAALPAIYIRETRVINQNFLYLRPFQPALTGGLADPLREWTRPLPQLGGFVRTSRKPSELVQELITAPISADEQYPILAQWQYGLGRVVAFTSDPAGGEQGWSRAWLAPDRETYNDFWNRIIDWSLRTVDDAGLSLETRYDNGKVRVTLVDNREAAARAARPLGNLGVRIAGTASATPIEAVLEPVAAGVYEATVDAEAAGSYTVTVSTAATEPDGTTRPVVVGRGAVAVPYPPEFSAVRDNAGLLAEIAALTGGRVIAEEDLANADLFVHDGTFSRKLQPLWYWLLYLAAFVLVADVAARRITFDPESLAAWVRSRFMEWFRPTAVSPESQQYFDRLKSKKAEVGEQLGTPAERPPAAAQAGPRPPLAPAAAPEAGTPPSILPPTASPTQPVLPPQGPAAKPGKPPPPAAGEDFATRLLKAKQKAREQMEEEGEK